MFLISLKQGHHFISCFIRFVTASRQLAKNLEPHTLNEHGLCKRYVRCLQVIEAVPVALCTYSILSHKSCLDFSALCNYLPVHPFVLLYIHMHQAH
jgi:hypothetical protein